MSTLKCRAVIWHATMSSILWFISYHRLKERCYWKLKIEIPFYKTSRVKGMASRKERIAQLPDFRQYYLNEEQQ